MARWALAAFAVVAAACASTVSSSPSATTPPSVTPTLRPTPVPTATMSATPTPARASVVFRMSVGGGLRYPGATVEEAPAFSLYHDGQVIYTRAAPVSPETSARYELWQARMTEDQVAALLDYALVEARLATTPSLPAGDVPVADATTTTFEVHDAGVDKVVSVYYVDYDDPSDPNRDARRRLAMLATELHAFGARVDSGEVTDLGRYEPERYLVTLDQPFGPDDLWSPVEWPWADLTPDDFELTRAGWLTAVVTAEQAKQLADPVNSAPDNIVVRAEDGEEYLVRIRPLLPDELP